MTGIQVALLDPKLHIRSDFACGEPSLDSWLKEQAGQSGRKDASRTYVTCDSDLHVLGYYTLCSFSVEADKAPKTVRVGGHAVPAVLLARLAVDESRQGTGMGGELLLSALSVAVEVADRVGTRLVAVHALHPAAAAFYQKYEFQPFESDPLTLYMPMQDIRATLLAASGR